MGKSFLQNPGFSEKRRCASGKSIESLTEREEKVLERYVFKKALHDGGEKVLPLYFLEKNYCRE